MIGAAAVAALLIADALVFGTFAELLAAGYDGESPDAISAWAFVLVGVAGYGIPRFIEGFELEARRAYAITGAAGVLLIYLLVRVSVAGDVALWDLGWVADFLRDAQTTAERGGHAIVAATLLTAAWARANMRSADEIEMETVARTVAVPFIVVTAIVVVGAATDRSGEVGRAGAAFYAFAILALACSQLSLSGATFGEVRAGSTAGILLAGTAGVALLTLLLIGLATSVLGPVLGPAIGTVTEWTLTILLTPFAWVLTWIFETVLQGNNPFPNLPQNVVNTSEAAGDPDSGERSAVSKAGLFLARTIALLALVALVAFVATVFVRIRNRQRARVADGRETATAGDLRGDLGSMFRSLFHRRGHASPGQATTEATRLYLEVLAKAEREGHGRPEGETAREFAPVLHETFATSVTDDITRAFETARYAGREPDARAIEDLRRRWQQEAR